MEYPKFDDQKSVYEYITSTGPQLPPEKMAWVQEEADDGDYTFAVKVYMQIARDYGMDDYIPYTVRENLRLFKGDYDFPTLAQSLSVDPLKVT
ncbi:hypothetical protein CCICO_08670 [Corynebacterium ciconiae DSM 44920]|uniref:hypothetical protein n=1 Tax=Corynebacterium ciconiae TaxID=227319 RepID=UPI00039E23CC|nr:hypothetical protein [Corynebacterium ciconiae]WKD61743.1 hypothetical protein CCICO_08670 [Corynebacterium ciconiae DSM 44920]